MTSRLTRTGLLEALGRDYVRTARAKGLSDGAALGRHALPNALLPVVTIVGSRLGFLFSGAVLVEIVFAWPGLGRLLLASTQTRDYPILLGICCWSPLASSSPASSPTSSMRGSTRASGWAE